jgi:site-specific DNA recombinase
MYSDKLDGRIDNAFFDDKSAESRTEQNRIAQDIDSHRTANQNHIEDGVRLLTLAQRAHKLFEMQAAGEKRKLLQFVLSNCSWKAGELTVQYRKPFDLLALAASANQQVGSGGHTETGHIEKWLGGRDSNPDRQIQSLEKGQADKELQGLSSTTQGEVRQNPQRPRNENDEGIHPAEHKKSDG